MATYIVHININNYIPSETDVEAAVGCLPPHKSVGHIYLHVEHLKMWLREAYPGEGATPLPPLMVPPRIF